jgi:hypothetical protein
MHYPRTINMLRYRGQDVNPLYLRREKREQTVIIQPATIQLQSNLWVVLELPKCIVVLSRDEFVAGLKRGKAWRRSAAMKARLGRKGNP